MNVKLLCLKAVERIPFENQWRTEGGSNPPEIPKISVESSVA